MNSNTIKSNKQTTATILYADHTGHSELTKELGEAIAFIIEKNFREGRWPMINSRKFQFSAESENDALALVQDTARLRQMFEDSDEPVIVSLDVASIGGLTMNPRLVFAGSIQTEKSEVTGMGIVRKVWTFLKATVRGIFGFRD